MNLDRHLDARESRRLKANDRALDRLDRQIVAAEPLIGELCREGRAVYYVWPTGGRYREGSRADLINFLIRNQYI